MSTIMHWIAWHVLPLVGSRSNRLGASFLPHVVRYDKRKDDGLNGAGSAGYRSKHEREVVIWWRHRPRVNWRWEIAA